MPASIVSTIEGLGIEAVDVTHTVREVGFGRPDHQVIVVRHQAVGQAPPLKSGQGLGGYIHENVAVSVVKEDVLLVIAPSHHVVMAVRDLNPWPSTHSPFESRTHAVRPCRRP
jgi:hypothetical protein